MAMDLQPFQCPYLLFLKYWQNPARSIYSVMAAVATYFLHWEAIDLGILSIPEAISWIGAAGAVDDDNIFEHVR